MQLIENPAGGFAFVPGGYPYSAGSVALPGFEVVRATLHRPLPLRDGFAAIDRQLAAEGRPAQALCAIELRSPEPWSLDGFGAFNVGYRAELEARGVILGDVNPVSRTNVAPAHAPPAEPSLYAFSYTVPSDLAARTFVVSGAGEMDERGILDEGDTSPEAMRRKAAFVMAMVAGRLAGLGCATGDVTAVSVYTIHSPLGFIADTLLAPLGPAAAHAFHWCYSRPPVLGLEFEADLRGVRKELRLY